MNLILLYGPPTAGKLTIARELEKLTGYKVLHNHLLLNPLSELFGFDNPVRKKLEPEFYLRIVEEAVNANLNMILTSCKTGSARNDFYAGLIKMIKDAGGNPLLVQVTAPEEVLLERVEDTFRGEHKKLNTKETLEVFLHEHPEVLSKIPYEKQLVIDTSDLSPKETALKVLKFYKIK